MQLNCIFSFSFLLTICVYVYVYVPARLSVAPNVIALGGPNSMFTLGMETSHKEPGQTLTRADVRRVQHLCGILLYHNKYNSTFAASYYMCC